MPGSRVHAEPLTACSTGDEAGAAPVHLTGGFLLGVYVVVPVVVIVALLDALVLQGALRPPPIREPNVLFLAWLLMGTPHVLASSWILARHAEYRHRYGRLALTSCALIVPALALSPYLHPDGAFAILGLLTALHVMRQQVGIGRLLGRPTGPSYALFGWVVVLLSIVFYEVAYLRDVVPSGVARAAEVAVLALLAVALGLAWWSHRAMSTAMGRAYLWANVALVVVSVGVYATGQVFLALMASRAVHDLTAFGFYVVHDANRRAAGGPAGRERGGWPGLARLPLACLAATMALELVGDRVLTPLLGYEGRYGLGLQLAIVLTLLHYVTEAVTWRRDSPYRRFVPVRL